MKKLKQWQADALLVSLTMWWGFSNVAMDTCLEDMNPFNLNAFRFITGTIIVLPFCWKRIKSCINRKTVKYGILIGISLFGTYICSTFGVSYTDISKVGFLCALAVIITPILNAIFLKHYPSVKTVICILLSFIGVMLLTLNKGFTINTANLKGDLLCVGCSFFYAIDILLTNSALSMNFTEDSDTTEHSGEGHIEERREERRKEYVDPMALGVIQLLLVGIINVIISSAFYELHMPSDGRYMLTALFLAVFCTGVSFVVQPIAQQYTAANRVGIIFTLEPVFNLLAAIFIAGEILTAREYIGGALMLLSIIIMELDFGAKD